MAKRVYMKASGTQGHDVIFSDATLMTGSYVTKMEGPEAHTLHPMVNWTLVTAVEMYSWRTFQIQNSVHEINTDNRYHSYPLLGRQLSQSCDRLQDCDYPYWWLQLLREESRFTQM